MQEQETVLSQTVLWIFHISALYCGNFILQTAAFTSAFFRVKTTCSVYFFKQFTGILFYKISYFNISSFFSRIAATAAHAGQSQYFPPAALI